MYDVLIIGGGVIGAAIAYELSQFNISIALVEKNNDVSDETTKANSGIVHAGFDPLPNTLMAKLNVEGSKVMGNVCEMLNVGYEANGALVLAFNQEEAKTLEHLKEQGIKNGVKNLSVISKDAVLSKEPNVTTAVFAGLYVPTSAIVDPFDLGIAFANVAAINGTKFFLEEEVTAIQKDESGFTVTTTNSVYKAKMVVNAAGVNAAKINNMVSQNKIVSKPKLGQYFLLDKKTYGIVNATIFQCPTKEGKGILVSPTTHGNVIVGPNSEDLPKSSSPLTTAQGLELVKKAALKSVPNLPINENIRNFSGIRAATDRDDFIIEQAPDVKGFFNVAGIKSPGLACSPAIGKYVVSLMEESGLHLIKNTTATREMPQKKQYANINEKIKENPAFGNVICRCETVTEGEIVEALHSPIQPKTLDAMKKRCRCGAGRCQGGFCMPRVQEIIARELQIPHESVLAGKAGTYITLD